MAGSVYHGNPLRKQLSEPVNGLGATQARVGHDVRHLLDGAAAILRHPGQVLWQ